jgi:hypothetical protein
MLHMPCQMPEMHKENYTYATKDLPHTQCKKSNTHQAPPTNEWKLLDLGVWWKYRVVGHVWVHGSRLSSLSLRCLSENDTSLLCAWFRNEALVLCNAYGTDAITLKWDMGILLTKVTHGVCDPKELRATTSSGNVLCLSSVEQHSIVCRKTKTPKKIPKTGKSQKWTSYPTDTRQNLRLKNHEAAKKRTRSTKGRSRECDASTW